MSNVEVIKSLELCRVCELYIHTPVYICEYKWIVFIYTSTSVEEYSSELYTVKYYTLYYMWTV